MVRILEMGSLVEKMDLGTRAQNREVGGQKVGTRALVGWNIPKWDGEGIRGVRDRSVSVCVGAGGQYLISGKFVIW